MDTSFGTGGSTTYGFGTSPFGANGMTLQRDGKIVVVGTVGSTFPLSVGILRFTAGGAPDTEFGPDFDGRYKNAFGFTSGSQGNDIVEDKNGRLVFAGQGYVSGSDTSLTQWLVYRVTSGGAADATFHGGQPQKFTILGSSQESYPRACCIALQSDGRIVVAGESDRDSNHNYRYFSIARFTTDGEFDSTFGINGQSYDDMSSQAGSVTDYPHTMVISSGGIIVGGRTALLDQSRFSAAKAQIDLLFADDFQ